LKNNSLLPRTLLLLSSLTVIFGSFCIFLNDFSLVLSIAFLSSLYYLDNSNRRIFSIVVSVILFGLNILGFIIGISYYLFAPASVIVALIISYAFSSKQSKSDAAFLATLICGVFTFLSYILLGMILKKNFSFEASIEFYNDLVTNLREHFINTMFEAYKAMGIDVTVEILTQQFNAQIYMIISYILIASFLIVGLSFKLFGFVVGKLAENSAEIKSWRFKTSNVFAYFYLILVFLAMFLTSSTDLLSIVVFNLYNIFLVVYAYVGFNVIKNKLKDKTGPIIATGLIIASVLIFSSLAIQLLAVSGVFYTIKTNREAIDSI